MTETNTDGTNPDVVDILTADHREMIELIGQIELTHRPAQGYSRHVDRRSDAPCRRRGNVRLPRR